MVLLISVLSLMAGMYVGDASSAAPDPPVGLLVMAHGGTPEWNTSVGDAVAPLRSEMPTALALGMADPLTMQAAMDSLAAEGVERVAVVRVFMSGESFRDQTEYLLGLRDEPLEQPMLMHGAGHGRGSGELRPLAHDVEVLMSGEGLMESWVAPSIMAQRASAVSRDPQSESVILIAHGMGDADANDRVLAEMERAATAIREGGFRSVRAFTLREDWDDAREAAEAEIRSFVDELIARGDRVLALPYRLSGFGPYAEVLEGRAYSAGEGFLPHPLITEWIRGVRHELLNPSASEG